MTSGGDMQLQESKITNRDMEFTGLMGDGSIRVGADIQVPHRVAEHRCGNLQQLREGPRSRSGMIASKPLSGRVLGDLGHWLMPRYGIDASVWELTFDELQVPALLERLYEQLKKRRDLNIESTNELRKGLPGADPKGWRRRDHGSGHAGSAVGGGRGARAAPYCPRPATTPRRHRQHHRIPTTRVARATKAMASEVVGRELAVKVRHEIQLRRKLRGVTNQLSIEMRPAVGQWHRSER